MATPTGCKKGHLSLGREGEGEERAGPPVSQSSDPPPQAPCPSLRCFGVSCSLKGPQTCHPAWAIPGSVGPSARRTSFLVSVRRLGLPAPTRCAASARPSSPRGPWIQHLPQGLSPFPEPALPQTRCPAWGQEGRGLRPGCGARPAGACSGLQPSLSSGPTPVHLQALRGAFSGPPLLPPRIPCCATWSPPGPGSDQLSGQGQSP